MNTAKFSFSAAYPADPALRSGKQKDWAVVQLSKLQALCSELEGAAVYPEEGTRGASRRGHCGTRISALAGGRG